ncbi:hypothetical protein COCMIDRAFT_91187 [Bipolaris oryzae ATCC 44560]|uniref:Ecp2 effector protein domain-containing protein n=1 Tax=Bipolaris oryzae ATCC 44560 TaxID=930090 RepID=W6ZTI3_COCMI|nr:uncharacterized protein COCMIDRAFT_91187 [Bipolaris oryzae ATCC 44560]EUC47036.1 hypothetical protein COCMIDRAFT_91187 [Bipolaris oryzae ATCC 44560]
MYTIAITLTALLSILHTTSASSISRFTRRGLPGAYYTCTDPNFSGACSWTQPNTDCHIQGSPEGIESLGPDEGTLCTLWPGFDCSGNPITSLRFPGIATGLPKFGSFNCSVMGNNQRNQAEALAMVGGVALDNGEIREFGLKTVDGKGREQGMIGLKKGVYY